MIFITIPGKPIAQARPRFARRGKFVTTYNPQETEAGRFAMALYAALPSGFVQFTGPVELWLAFFCPIPSSASKRDRMAMAAEELQHVKKPDLDNLAKFVKDCAKGVLWVDDSQVVNLRARKAYSLAPRTEITVAPLPWLAEKPISVLAASQEV